MKNICKKINWQTILLSLYVALIYAAWIFANVSENKMIIILIIAGFAVCAYILLCPIIQRIKIIDVKKNELKGTTDKYVFFIMSTITALVIMMIWFAAFYPGAMSPDSLEQYEQAIQGKYNDWHPVLHTLIFFKIPLLIIGCYSGIVIFQIIYFALTIGYMALTIAEISSKKAAIASVAYIVLNPFVCQVMLYPWKDVAFGISSLLCMTILVREICKLDGGKNNVRMILLGVITAFATIFRHNGILFTITFLIVSFFDMDRRRWVVVTTVFALSFLTIKVPLYQLLDAENPDQRVVETMGLPLTVIANVAKETPELMDEELSEFVYEMAPQEKWDEYYTCGNFNSIKWNGVNLDVVEEKGTVDILRLMIKSIKISPNASIKAFITLTDIVYGFESGLKGNVWEDIVDNSYGIELINPNNILSAVVSVYHDFVDKSVFRYVRTCGVALFAILTVALSCLNVKNRNSWKEVLIVSPIFLYDFGTMFFLTGEDARFFICTFFVTPLLIVFLLSRRDLYFV